MLRQALGLLIIVALSGAGEMQIPAAGPKGRNRTLWLLDNEAAAEVQKNIVPPRI